MQGRGQKERGGRAEWGSWGGCSYKNSHFCNYTHPLDSVTDLPLVGLPENGGAHGGERATSKIRPVCSETISSHHHSFLPRIMVTHQVDGFKIPHGDDTHYISREYQLGALSLEKDGCPFRISTTKNTSIYLVVRHEHHEAPAHLVLSPFTAPLYPNQTFYGVHIQYTRCCDQGPNQDAITKTLRRVYDVLFPLGECRFDEHK